MSSTESRATKRLKIPNRVSIHERPAVIETRKEFGHWEGDLMLFQHGQKGNLLTLRERKSRYLVVGKKPDLQWCFMDFYWKPKRKYLAKRQSIGGKNGGLGEMWRLHRESCILPNTLKLLPLLFTRSLICSA